MKKRTMWKQRLAGYIILLFALLIAIGVWYSSEVLTVTRYTLTTDKLTEPVRIVHLTDLHNHEFGRGNERLATLIEKQKPDLILMTGDMLNGRENETGIVASVIERLTDVAPVYFSYGNHEVTHERTFGRNLTTLFEQAGAVVLERAQAEVTVRNQTLRLGGIYGYCLPEKYLDFGEAKSWECSFLKRFQDTESYTILLAHLPTCWIRNDNLDEWDVDCILSGHEHGGQIRLPGIGGLYAPDQGIFPGRASGLYHSTDGTKTLVLSRGLGSSGSVPRFNNVPEIVVVDILPEMK